MLVTVTIRYYSAVRPRFLIPGGQGLNGPGIELPPKSWTNFKGFYGEVRD